MYAKKDALLKQRKAQVKKKKKSKPTKLSKRAKAQARATKKGVDFSK